MAGYEWQLTARLRTAITLAALALLLVLGVAWGWGQVLKPFPGKVDAPICVDTAYKAGDALAIEDVTVSVLNGSGREGLAAATMADLQTAGFAPGTTGNAPKGTQIAGAGEIWVDDVKSPAAKLLRGRIGKVPVVAHPEVNYPGAILVLGAGFTELHDGRGSVTLKNDAEVCSPPVD